MEDEQILDLFFARSEEAIGALDRAYGRLCLQIARGILSDAQDAEECVSDAYLAAWNTIPPSRPQNLTAFLCRLVRNRSISRHRANTAARRHSPYDVALEELSGALAAPSGVEDALDAKLLSQAISRFLDTLSPQNRAIFLGRHWFSESYADIAARVGLPEKTVSVRLTRLRRQLREFLSKEEVYP